MKPLKLSMQAFGPFPNTEVVDFTQFGQNPLFLINGPTGAGKSSILDAICFALYGQTTGAEREAAQMRCDHAVASVVTEVTLEFQLGSKTYRIRRIPVQEKPKSRGEGTTIQQAEAQLYELDGTPQGTLLVSKSVSEATTKIKELVGLGVDQFRQVMVLPQGKFRELLMADSSTRETIFGQLFATQIYKRIENALKDQAAGIRQAVYDHQNEVRGILKGAEVDSEEALDTEYSEITPLEKEALDKKVRIQQVRDSHQKAVDQAKRLISDFEKLTNHERDLGLKEAEAADIGEKVKQIADAESADRILNTYTAYTAAVSNLNIKKNRIGTIEATIDSFTENLKAAAEKEEKARLEAIKIEDLKFRLNVLNDLRTTIEELKGSAKDLSSLKANFDKAKAESESTGKALTTLREELARKETFIDENRRVGEQRVSEEGNQEKLIAILEKKRLQTTAVSDLVTETSSREKAKLKQDECAEIAKSASQLAMQKEMDWHTGQAALLARELKADAPCPVCGSKLHPDPACLPEGIEWVSKDEVDEARRLSAEADENLTEAKAALKKSESALEGLNDKIAAYTAELGPYAEKSQLEIEEEIAGLKESLEALKTKEDDLNAAIKRASEIRLEIPQKETDLSEKHELSSAAERAVINAQSKHEYCESKVPVELREEGSIDVEFKKVSKEVERLNKALEEAAKELRNCEDDLSKERNTLSTLKEQIDELEKEVGTACMNWEQTLVKTGFETTEKFLAARLEEEVLNSLRTDVSDYRTEVIRLQGLVEDLKTELQDKQIPDLSTLEKGLLEAQTDFTLADDSWRQVESRRKDLEKYKSKLVEAHSKNEKLMADYKIIGTLSEVANGQTGNRISLQRFVLSVLLDDVLIQASHRLLRMSKGRYRLVRKEDRSKGMRASGLDLEVEDGDTGKARPVATLSGGESFMAALSLALGLSDVVQSYAGGVKLDMLFIDEGFGSLDSESLDAAIKVLIDLQASGRMIGIISHVSELKEQMAMRLDVVAGRGGSQISTHFV